MAGAPPESMALLCAALEAMCEPDHNLFASPLWERAWLLPE